MRQYTLQSGQREVLIDLFEREFVESQEAVGATLIGQFRDLDRPDRFVWLRGFADMERRREMLSAFYGGPVWAAHRSAANATIIDSDNVLLLRPALADSRFDLHGRQRAMAGATATASTVVVATVYSLTAAQAGNFPTFYADYLLPALRAGGVQPLASFVTESAENTYPRLPVRLGEHVFIWFASFPDAATQARVQGALDQSTAWTALDPALRERLTAPPEILRLAPTARSLVHE